MAEVKRSARVAERLREELSILFSREVKDPRVAGVVVTRVEVSDDLRVARAYVRLLEGDAEGSLRAPLLAGLERATPMLRREVGRRASLRFAPDLRFFYDEGLDHTTRVEELLHEISKEKK